MKRMIRIMLLCLILLCHIPCPAFAAQLLIPGGQLLGLEVSNDAVTVAAFDDCLGHTARNAGIHIGDEILEINGRAVHSAGDVKQILSESSGEIRIKVLSLLPLRT